MPGMALPAHERYKEKLFPGSSHCWAISQCEPLDRSTAVLDIGSGSGVMGAKLRDLGFGSIRAVEVDAETRAQTASLYSDIVPRLSCFADRAHDTAGTVHGRVAPAADSRGHYPALRPERGSLEREAAPLARVVSLHRMRHPGQDSRSLFYQKQLATLLEGPRPAIDRSRVCQCPASGTRVARTDLEQSPVSRDFNPALSRRPGAPGVPRVSATDKVALFGVRPRRFNVNAVRPRSTQPWEVPFARSPRNSLPPGWACVRIRA
jgi:hypothetical protein